MRGRRCGVVHQWPKGWTRLEKVPQFTTEKLRCTLPAGHDGNHEDHRDKNPRHDGVPNWRDD